MSDLDIDPQKTQAVLIGTSRFKEDATLTSLPAVENNLDAMTRVLTDPEVVGLPPENVVTILNADNSSTIGKAVAKACQQAKDAVIIYYAGHGLIEPRSGKLFLTSTNTTRDHVRHDGWDIDALREETAGAVAQKRILILDCCFSGRLFGNHMGVEETLVCAKLNLAGTFAMTACPPNDTARAPVGSHHTAFTAALVELLQCGIENAGPILTLNQLYIGLVQRLGRDPSLPQPQKFSFQQLDSLGVARNRWFAEHRIPARTGESAPPDGAAGNHTENLVPIDSERSTGSDSHSNDEWRRQLLEHVEQGIQEGLYPKMSLVSLVVRNIACGGLALGLAFLHAITPLNEASYIPLTFFEFTMVLIGNTDVKNNRPRAAMIVFLYALLPILVLVWRLIRPVNEWPSW